MACFSPIKTVIPFAVSTMLAVPSLAQKTWESKYIKVNRDNTLTYLPDEKGNTIPDFSRVGYYYGDKKIPDVAVVKTISATDNADQQQLIQAAIDELARKTAGSDGIRGAILLKKGVYKIAGTIKISTSGIVLRGEGDDTKLIATGTEQRSLIQASGNGSMKEIPNTRVKITDAYVPFGAMSFNVSSASGYKKGDQIMVYRPGTDNWISDIKMDQIAGRTGTIQWKADDYNLQFERVITNIEGNKIFIDEPIVMAMETKYGGGEIFAYTLNGRISNVGIENLYCESEYTSDTAENHGWDAIKYNLIENSWVQNVTSRYFGYSCVNLGGKAKFVTVTNCKCLDAKSVITGGRRYSFNNDGSMNLVMNCHTTEGRHDYVTGGRTCGPNVFYNCTATGTHADIGPHHRWGMGTLYDNITTDGEINVQDRGNMGSGHGWAGVNQVLWNCKVKRAAVQKPWVSATNYVIGLQGEQYPGHFKDRENGDWEGTNKKGLNPASLYLAQLKARSTMIKKTE